MIAEKRKLFFCTTRELVPGKHKGGSLVPLEHSPRALQLAYIYLYVQQQALAFTRTNLPVV